MGHAPRAILAGMLGFAVSFVAACGGGAGLLSGDQSNALRTQLDAISSAVTAGDCGAAASAARLLADDVERLPATINTTLRGNLAQGASTVAALAGRDCQTASTATTIPPVTTSTTTSSTTTSSSTTTKTTTTPTTTTTTTSTTTTPTSTTTTTTPATTSTGAGTTSTASSTSSSGGAGIGGSSGANGNAGSGGAGTGVGNRQ